MQTPAHHRIGCEGAIQVTTGDTPILAELDKPQSLSGNIMQDCIAFAA